MTSAGFRRERLGPLADAVASTLDDLALRDAVDRLWARDHTLWDEDPTEISDRLGWLEVADDMVAAGERLDGFAQALTADGFDHAVVMGMGGSSLFPEVLARSFAPVEGRLRLTVLDSTDPAAVARVAANTADGHTLFLASSKSGSTVETRSHLDFFSERVGQPDHFAVVTDPGSELAALARERNYREVFENRPDIGGRYSALSFFGLVPAAVAGIDWAGLAGRAQAVAESLGSENPAVNTRLRPRSHPGATPQHP
ncbi:MAG: bifunctional transaldolase/phosoglucose isomerase, partial [Acidimicrobiales bacterium]